MDSYSNPNSCVSTSHVNKEKKTTKGGMKLSTDPQSVAARQRRHRISDRFKILQSLVPGGSKLDTVSLLEEAIQYVKFLKAQIWLHQAMIGLVDVSGADDPSLIFPANQCSVVPVHHAQNTHSGDQVGEAEMEYGWPVSWGSGEGNSGPF